MRFFLAREILHVQDLSISRHEAAFEPAHEILLPDRHSPGWGRRHGCSRPRQDLASKGKQVCETAAKAQTPRPETCPG